MDKETKIANAWKKVGIAATFIGLMLTFPPGAIPFGIVAAGAGVSAAKDGFDLIKKTK